VSEPRPPLSADQEERLARYRAGTLSAAEREAFEREVLASDALAEALYSEQSLESVRVAPARPARAGHLLAVAAAVVAMTAVALLWPRGGHDRPPGTGETLRGGGDSGAAVPLEPRGDLSAPPTTFRWRSDPGAESYRIELFGADGRRLATAVAGETTFSAASLAADTLRAGSWRVVPVGPDGLERPSSPAVRFQTRPR
jgi:hypothetical protein